MTHIEEGALQAYLDDEIEAGARVDIDRHLATCSACAAELQQLRESASVFAAAIRGTDIVAPVLAAQARFATARRFEPRLVTPAPRRAFARAAMFIVGLAAVASATVPGSPVRAWISSALTRVGLLDQSQDAAAPPVIAEVPAVAGTQESAAISIEPVEGNIRIILSNVKAEANVTVQLVEGTRAFVEATGDAARARFRTGPGRLEVVGVDGGRVVVQIPRAIPNAIVEQDGRVIYTTGN